jgi:hypothetical protein
MNTNRYTDLIVGKDLALFDFISTGPRGAIRKRIAFMSTDDTRVVQLAFGDLIDGSLLDDRVISNNGDRDKVLATIIGAVDIYTNAYPQRWVYFEGSTDARTRLYRIVISQNIHDLSTLFEIQGLLGHWSMEPFQINRPYRAFLIRRKNTNFKV